MNHKAPIAARLWSRWLFFLLLVGVGFLSKALPIQHHQPDKLQDYPNCTDRPPKQDLYDVIVTDLNAVGNHGASLISRVNGSSDFQFNFHAPWFPASPGQAQPQEGLIVRVVDYERHPEWADAGAMVVVPVTLDDQIKPLSAGRVTEDRVTWAGAAPAGPRNHEMWGAADPRVTYRPFKQQYYVTWDNCTMHCWPKRVTFLSTTPDPMDKNAWTFHGQVFPFPYTSGASLLFRDDNVYDKEPTSPTPPHLAFVCNSNNADTIFVTESHDGLNWTIPQDPSRRILMKGRPGCWDEKGVAAGPQPQKLSSGDYLYIYNIDTGWPYHPNPLGRCAIGWAVLDKSDPTKIVARSHDPLITATQSWETCAPNRNETTCNVPMVVFASGLKPLGNNEFYIIYGGADSVVEVSRIKVIIKEASEQE